MINIGNWLDRLQNKQAPVTSHSSYRLNEALEVLRSAKGIDAWLELSTHYNGFIREVAVRELCVQSSPEALVALINRLNDWVPQVRNLALEGLNQYLSISQAQALLFSLDHLMALSQQQRADHGPTLMSVRAVLQSPEIQDEVFAHFLTRQGRTARYLFTLLLEKNFASEQLLRSSLAHRELTVRLAAVSACQELPIAQAAPLLVEAFSKPAAKVQVCVLRALLPLLNNPKPMLCKALLDSSPSIRSLALWAAPRNNIDPLSVLSERVKQGMPTAKRDWLGVLGLAAEISAELDGGWLRKALDCNYASVRRAAVSMLNDDQVPDLLRMLDDSSNRVFRTAVAALNTQPWSSVSTGLAAKLDRDWHNLSVVHRQAILQLKPAWQQLAYLLRRLEAEPVSKALWLNQIDQWCDRQYQIVDPVTSKIEREALVKKLQNLGDVGLIRKESVGRVAG
jgi:HEAT repeat protein